VILRRGADWMKASASACEECEECRAKARRYVRLAGRRSEGRKIKSRAMLIMGCGFHAAYQ